MFAVHRGDRTRWTNRKHVLDAALVLAALGTGALKMQPWQPRLDLGYLAAFVLVVSAFSLPVRRRWPGPVFALAATGNTLQLFTERSSTSSIDAGLVVAAHALALYGRGPVRVALPVAAVAPMALGIVHSLDAAAGRYTVLAGAAAAVVVVALPWLVGANARMRRQAMTALADRAARLEAERELRATRAVLQERGRIARELHDIVAHHVSVMGVQAGAARLAMPVDTRRAEAALRSVESTARQAVGEMRRMLGMLRASDVSLASPTAEAAAGPASLAPQPGLGDLPGLAAGFAGAGLQIDLSVDWRLEGGTVEPPLDAGEAVQLSVYRLVEQGLTNVLEHGHGAATTVVVKVDRQSVEVVITNEAAPAAALASRPPAGDGRGHGTVGMRERVKMLGGTLNAGPLPDGGYRVYARLPLGQR